MREQRLPHPPGRGQHITLHGVADGYRNSLASVMYIAATSVDVKIKVYSSIQAWIAGTLKINALDTAQAAGDDPVVSETFGSPRLATICSAG